MVPGWFTSEPEVRDAIESMWLILAIMQPLAALVYVWDGIVMGAAEFGYLAWAMVVSGVVADRHAGCLWSRSDWGLPGVWWAIGLLNVVRAGTLGWWHLRPASSLRPASARREELVVGAGRLETGWWASPGPQPPGPRPAVGAVVIASWWRMTPLVSGSMRMSGIAASASPASTVMVVGKPQLSIVWLAERRARGWPRSRSSPTARRRPPPGSWWGTAQLRRAAKAGTKMLEPKLPITIHTMSSGPGCQ